MSDAFVQVAPDSIGKQIDMETVRTSAGSSIYQQRAKLVGDPAEILAQLLDTERRVLACLRAMLANQNAINSTPNFEDDYFSTDPADFGP